MIIKTKLKNIYGIMILGIILIDNKIPEDYEKIVINHEKIHVRQMLELGIIFFYLWYLVEYLFYLVKYRNFNKAYSNISFEREAYEYEFDLDYLKKRKKYKWINLKK